MKNFTLLVFVLVISIANSKAQISSVKHDTSADTTVFSSVKTSPQSNGSESAIAPFISFNDNSYNHNMHITSDGTYYYTINGADSTVGQINKFDLNTSLVVTYPINIDGRGLAYNWADGYFYASLYEGSIVRIDSLEAGTYTTLFTHAMQNDEAAFALSKDGTKFYDFYQGTLLVHDLATGVVLNTITGLSYGEGFSGGESSVAVDETHIYTWDANTRTVYVYDMNGTLERTAVLDNGSYGISLSVTNNNTLFVSKDGNYGVGTWYGVLLSDILPVTLSKFSANTDQKNVLVQWQTANEENVSHFVLQRSTDNVNFAQVNTVNPKVSSFANSYQYNDLNMAKAGYSTLYYRLSIVDKDGSSKNSNTIAVQLSSSQGGISVYPNPVNSILHAYINSGKNEKTTLQVIDMGGKIVAQQSVQLVTGNNAVSVPVSSLVKGNYILQIKGTSVYQSRFLKQ